MNEGFYALDYKTKEDFGGLSNMAPGCPLQINGVRIPTAEALYQACRFPHLPDLQREIIESLLPPRSSRACQSPAPRCSKPRRRPVARAVPSGARARGQRSCLDRARFADELQVNLVRLHERQLRCSNRLCRHNAEFDKMVLHIGRDLDQDVGTLPDRRRQGDAEHASTECLLVVQRLLTMLQIEME